MAEKLDRSVSKKNKKYWLVALLSIPLLCLFCYLQVTTAGDRYYKKLDKQSPHPTKIHVFQPELITTLSDHTYDLLWTDENTLLTIDSSNNADITLNIKTREVIQETYALDNFEEMNFLQFEPNGASKILATCPEENLATSGRDAEDGKFEITLLREKEAIATFPFSSQVWKGTSYSPFYRSGFSPKCQYFYLVLYGEMSVEVPAREELWLLDIHRESLQLAFTGREYPYAIFDAPVQHVAPSWSPNGQELVFGDGQFGLEIYNVMSEKRRFAAGPSLNLYYPEWSPSGEWIAVDEMDERGDGTLAIISPDGKEIAFASDCLYFSDFEWSPNGKQLAYICADETNSLWLWEIDK